MLLLRAAVIVSLAIVAARLMSHGAARDARRVLREARLDPIVWGVAALLAAGAVSSAFSLSPRVSFVGERASFAGFTTLVCYAALFAATRSAAGSAAARCALLWAAFIGAVGASAYALVQRLGLDPIAWGRPDWDPRRVWGSLGNPTFLSDHLVSVLPVALYLALRAWRAGRRTAACAVAAASAWIGFAALLTFSRSGVLAMGISLPALALGWRGIGERAGARVLAIASGGVIAVALLAASNEPGPLDSTWARLSRLPDFQQEARVEIWRSAVRMFADHPWTGVGLDAFHLAFPAYRTPRYWELEWGYTATRAHNELLHVAATQGIAGLAALALFTWAIGISWLRALRRADTPCDRARVVALGCSLLAIAVRSLFGLTVAAQGVLVATYAGLLSAESQRREPAAHPSPRIQRTFGAVAFIAWLVFIETILASGPTSRLGARSRLPRSGCSDRCSHSRSSPVASSRPRLRIRNAAAPVRSRSRSGPLPHSRSTTSFGSLSPPTSCVGADGAGCLAGSSNAPRSRCSKPSMSRRAQITTGGSSACCRNGGRSAPRIRRCDSSCCARRTARTRARAPSCPRTRTTARTSLARSPRWRTSRGPACQRTKRSTRTATRRRSIPPIRWSRNDAARAALRLGEIDTAEGFARASLSLHSGEGEPRAILGRAARERGDLERAERELSAATGAEWRGRQGAEIAAWEDLARVRAELGRRAAALAAWREVLRRDPEHPEAHREVLRLQTDGDS